MEISIEISLMLNDKYIYEKKSSIQSNNSYNNVKYDWMDVE